MAHFALLWKARTIEKYRQNYENEKINSIIMSSSDVPDKTLFQRWKHYKHGMQKRLSRTFSKWYPEGSIVSNFFVSLRTDMKLPSILLRSFYGFIGGLLLTYLGFMFFVFQLSVSVMHATVLSSIIGVLLTLGLTFSNRMRCLVFLLVPQLFSRVGRYTLTCYALVLILTGPATNTLKNCEVLSESMACSQEQIKLNVRQINDSIKKPYNSIKDSLKRTVARMNVIVSRLKIALIKTNKLILSIASLIQAGYSWLVQAADACNDALGTPHQKCLSILKEHCDTNKHINLNDINAKTVKNFNKNAIRDILDAIGIKNVKRPQEHDNFDAGRFIKYRDKIDFMAKDEGTKSYKYLKEHKDTKRDRKRSPNTDDVKRLNDVMSDKPWFCDSAKVAKTVCDSIKSYEKFCVAADFAGDTFLATIRKKLKTFINRISALIHVQLNIQHTYTFIGNSSSSNQIAAGIVTEIRNRADPIFTWLSWSSCVTSLFLLLIIFRAKHYQHMFETRSRFDNRFITKEFRELDLKRLREGRETVLPLNTRERAKYVTTTSFRLVASEKLHLNRSAVFMTVATFKLLIHIVADYSLFWVLTTIRHHGKLHCPLHPGTAETGAFISGTGFVARLLQSFVDTMNMQLLFPPSEHSCLPNPYPPDIKRYFQIGFLIFLLWFFALFEPYGLRMRHLIMGHYRPQRAKDRAVWLYNHVLRTRASFMKFARRKLHREYKYSSQSKFTFLQCVRSYAPLRWLSSLFRMKPDELRCLLCNISEDTSDHNKEFIKCEVPNCPGIYCPCCFSDIGQLCTICLSPSDYGDYSDVSLEKGSSDEGSSDDDNYHEDNNPSGSYRRKSNNDSCTFENTKDNDSTYSKRSTFSKQRQLGYFLGRIDIKHSETLPLLKQAVDRDSSNNGKQNQFTNSADAKTVIHKHTKQQTRIEEREYSNGAISKGLNNIYTRKLISTMDILLFSLYRITNNPLEITKLAYTTKVAKYLRRRKLLRHKKCMQRYSKYFMTCGNNNINKINKNTNKDRNNRGQVRDSNDVNKTKKDAKNNIYNIEVKCFADQNEHENFGSINEIAISKTKRHSVRKGELYTAISKCWKNCILAVLLDKASTKTKEKPIENKHKRKKKRKKSKILTSKGGKKEHEDKIGNSRLFAFLDERNWANRYDNTDDRVIHTAEGGIHINNHETDDKIIVNNIIIPRLDLNLSSESNINLHIHKSNEENICYNKRKDQIKNAFETFFKSIACSSCEFFRNRTDVDVRDRFNYEASETYLQTQGVEQDLVRSKKSNASPGSYRSVSSKKDVLPEGAKELALVRILNPLFIMKNHCSSILLRRKKNKDKILDTTRTNPNKPDNKDNECNTMAVNVEKRVQTVTNKIVQCKVNKQSPREISARTVINVVDEIKVNKIENKYDKETQTMPTLIQTDDKEVTAFPLMTSCGCQKILGVGKTQDFAVQVKINRSKKKKICECKDKKVMTCVPTCTCAAQCRNTEAKKYIGSVVSKKLCDEQSESEEENNSDTSTIETIVLDTDRSRTDTTVCSYANLDYRNTFRDIRSYQIKRHLSGLDDPAETTNCHGRILKDQGGKLTYQYGRLNEQVKRQNDQGWRQNDQEGRQNVEYRRVNDQVGRSNDHSGRRSDLLRRQNDHSGRQSDQFGRLKIRVVTKSNQSTLTDRATCCDASTATKDWWSPLVEKKDISKAGRLFEKRRKDCGQPRVRERRTFRSRGMSTEEKNVSFRSKTQFIPSRESGFDDILSPSRYLLESQKYYNELFNHIYGSPRFPRVYPVANLQKNNNMERDRSQINNFHHKRRARKTKRLEESYSPRRDIQTSLRMKRFDFRSPEAPRKSLKNKSTENKN